MRKKAVIVKKSSHCAFYTHWVLFFMCSAYWDPRAWVAKFILDAFYNRWRHIYIQTTSLSYFTGIVVCNVAFYWSKAYCTSCFKKLAWALSSVLCFVTLMFWSIFYSIRRMAKAKDGTCQKTRIGKKCNSCLLSVEFLIDDVQKSDVNLVISILVRAIFMWIYVHR